MGIVGAAVPSSSDRAPTWRPPASWRRILTVESHAAGEPLRMVTGGLDPIPGGTILDKRRFARERLDGVRRGLMFEPRGHADMYGAILTEPVTPDGDAGVLFMHNEGWSTMCGHGVIAVVTVALEIGLLAERAVVRLDTPAGRVSARVAIERARGRLVSGDSFVVESIIGTRFVGRIARELRWEGYDAVVPEIEGSAWITGRNEILIAPDDPLAEGFILR